MALAGCQALLGEFKGQVESSNFGAAKGTLSKLKVALIKLPGLSGKPSPTANAEKECSRTTLELACLMNVKDDDMKSFDRHFAQLQGYYSKDSGLAPSAMQSRVIGMFLLHLLVENELSEFHCQLELLSESERQDANINFPVKLEQYLMEGSYTKLLAASKHCEAELKGFMEELADTVRDEISGCCEAAHPTISQGELQKMLSFGSLDELQEYAADREGLVLDSGVYRFKPEVTSAERAKGQKSDLQALKLVQQSLMYATELERIV